MAKKKAVKKTTSKKKSAKPGKRSAAKKKRPAKKPAAKKSVKKASRVKRPAKKAPRAKAAKKQAAARASKSPSKKKRTSAAPALKPRQYVEKMSVTIERPDNSGDLVATESLGGAALVHHTVHPGAETTAIPGRSYQDLKKLGEGSHEIEVVKTLPPPPVASPANSP
ncbi:MAG: hypothetical protein ACR2FY_18680 [Pirellulaceae bacterium]